MDDRAYTSLQTYRRRHGSLLLVGVMKINVDASIKKNSNKASASTVTRDFSDMFVGASVLISQGISPEIMRAVACRESLALVSDLMLQKFKMACDNITVVRNIQDKGF
jgi:hypothetical protein